MRGISQTTAEPVTGKITAITFTVHGRLIAGLLRKK
jgi:hypothetical protein